MEMLGDKIAKLRKKKNMTQIDLGELLHVSDKTISKWEQGKSNPSYEFLDEMSKIFDVKIEYFLKDVSMESKFKVCISFSFKFIKRNWHKMIFTFLLFFFAFYFFNTIDSLEMYEIKDTDKQDKISFDGGYYIKSKSKVIIYINNIKYNNPNEQNIVSQKIKLYTMKYDDKIYFYESDELEDIIYKDFIGYTLDRKMANDLADNLYLEIETLHSNNEFTKEEAKLTLKIAISSNTIFYNDKLNVDNEQENNESNIDISKFDLVMNGYEKIKDSKVYYKKDGNYQLYFDLDAKAFRYNFENSNKLEKFSFYYNTDEVNYVKIEKEKALINFSYYKSDNILQCYEGSCDNYLEIYDAAEAFFYKTINEFSKS